ncbi:glutathione S-transferase family protein [Teredinibacter sp. KSP-S5-2]|uniref:glutathione S-transferase family protein n=1 Tax=Teredinibacter sp. KSP-S5-2 TaxID=3034506 RepID=UPI002934A6A9|nr:glutathione S-transferase family protein [Teredinibacter sp. KSP-S5-2]WNO08801.1 glutathione S-transferase family protein [Teredinibacter sp. KSP-S5-2]
MKQNIYIVGPQFSTFLRSVLLTCEEKQVDYEFGLNIDGQQIEFPSDKLKSIHPFAKVPVLIHGEFQLTESIAICHYLNDIGEGPSLTPDTPKEKARHLQWCSYIATYIDKALIRDYLVEFIKINENNQKTQIEKIKGAIPNRNYCLSLIEEQISKNKFVTSDHFTIADALLAPIVDYMFRLPGEFKIPEQYQAIKQYRNRILERNNAKKILKDAK